MQIDLAFDGLILNKPRSGPAMFRLLSEADFLEILALQQKVFNDLTDDRLFYCSSEDELTLYLEKGICIGSYVGQLLVSYALAIDAGFKQQCYAECAGSTDRVSKKILDYEEVVVDPDYRGNKLQKTMTALIIEAAKDLDYQVVYASVSPHNPYSLKNFLNIGFKIEKTVTIFDQKERHIVYFNTADEINLEQE